MSNIKERFNPGNYRVEVLVTYHETDPYKPSEPIVSSIYSSDGFADGIAVENLLNTMSTEALDAVLTDMTGEDDSVGYIDDADRLESQAKDFYYHEKYGDAF